MEAYAKSSISHLDKEHHQSAEKRRKEEETPEIWSQNKIKRKDIMDIGKCWAYLKLQVHESKKDQHEKFQ